jgi:hypothetical protein
MPPPVSTPTRPSATTAPVGAITASAVIENIGAKGAIAIAAGPDAVWIGGDREVIRVDPADNSTTTIPVPIDDGSWTGMVVVGEELWASDYYGNAVVHVDLPSGATTRIDTPTPTSPVLTAFGLWVAPEHGGTLTRIDRATRSIDLEVPAAGLRKFPAAVGKELWFGGIRDGLPLAVRLDPASGETIGDIVLPKDTGCYFRVGDGGLVWTMGGCGGAARNAMAVIDPVTGSVTLANTPKAFLGDIVAIDGTTWMLRSPAAGKSGVIVAYASNGTVDRVLDLPVDLDPDWAIVAFGSLWVPADQRGRVYRFPVDALAP